MRSSTPVPAYRGKQKRQKTSEPASSGFSVQIYTHKYTAQKNKNKTTVSDGTAGKGRMRRMSGIESRSTGMLLLGVHRDIMITFKVN